MLKPVKILCKVCGSLVGFVAVVVVGAIGYFRLSVNNYYKNSEKAFVIPECNNNFIAQGLDFDESTNNFFMTGYMNDHSASPIYVMAKGEKKDFKKVLLAKQDGTVFTGHNGGISVNGDYVYIAGGSSASLHVYSKADVMSAKHGDTVNELGEFKTHVGEDSVNISFTTIHNNKIYVGEFYRAGNYETKDNHHISTSDLSYNQAVMVSYNLDSGKEFGINPVAQDFYSLPNQVQGACFDSENNLYLSTSYGVAFSHLTAYNPSKSVHVPMTLLGDEREVIALDSKCEIKSTKIAPMSEEIEIVDGKIYTMCESASNKYIFGKLTSAKWCYATNIEALK